ncbi:MAG: V-type ATP synthase subunit E [Clostridia bacterium]|nr:V-type ATP synthase subunit E [Clostridia bacterium]
MNGLDLIIESILSDARSEAERILTEAGTQAEAIRAEAKVQAETRIRTAGEAAEAEAAAVIARAESSAAMTSRRIVLDARRRMVAGMVDRAAAHLAQMPDAEKIRLYADFLGAAKGGETVVFAAADLASGVGAASVEAWRKARLEAGLPPLDLETAAEPGSFSGGLVLRRGLIEDNLTFEMLTRQSRDDLESYAASLIEK